MILTGKEHQEAAWNRYHNHLSKREGEDRIRIKQGHEFKLIAEMIDDGILPFLPKPIAKEHLREPNIKFELREYQKQAWNKFLEYGAVGVFWSFGAGKTFIGLYALASLKGQKLVVVPTLTLKEQWEERIKQYCGNNNGIGFGVARETEVVTYHAFEKVRNKHFALVIFDEVQHLPANQFSRFSTLDTDYRIGLSGTPYREDGRTDYIFALSGFPIGLDWRVLVELGVFKPPDVRIYVFDDKKQKIGKLKELLQIPLKTIVFCDSIDLGERLSKDLEIPFVYGATRNRLEVINESKATIVSRVGDEGLSLPDIERVIEIDFLFGSRRQEGQRAGRLAHSKIKGEHIVLATEQEFEDYQKRFYALYEKGFKVEVIR